MLADYHTHTYYSDDSECPMEDMVKKAVAIGLDEIAFTCLLYTSDAADE